MIITIVCDVLGKENNGVTVAAYNLIRYMKSQGHTVRVLCADQEKINEEGYYVVSERNFLIFNNYVEKNGVSLAKPDKAIIQKAIEGSDIVHIMLPFSLGKASAKIAQELDIPVTAGCHFLAENFTTHLHLQKVSLANKLTYLHFKDFYSSCDRVQYVSQYLKDLYEEMYKIDNGCVISNGVNDRFKPTTEPIDIQDKIHILFIGRYAIEKSHRVLIEAIPHSKYKDKIQLIFAGTGPLEEELRKQSASLPLPPIFGFYSRDELLNIIHKSYLYVHPAETEAEGIACLEAIACGVVPIITDSKNCATKAFAIDEHSLFQNMNAEDLANKIDWWIDHPEERNAYSKKYAALASEEYSQGYCMQKMEKMFLDAIQNHVRKEDK